MPASIRRVAQLVVAWVAAAGCEAAPPSLPAGAPRVGSIDPAERTPIAAAAALGSVGSAVDERGVPQLILAAAPQPAAPGATVEEAARAHVLRHAGALAISPETAGRLELVALRDFGPGGLLARFRQKILGVEIYRARVAVLMRPDRSLVALSGQLRSDSSPVDRSPFRHSDGEIAAAVLAAHGVAEADLLQSVRVDRIYFAERGRLIPAFRVELLPRDADGFRYLVSDGDRRILARRDLTASDSFDYRVFADGGGDHRPMDAPEVDYTPYPKPMPDGSEPDFVLPNLITMEGFNHNPQGVADPWLPANATESLGNNVDGYTDRNPPDGFSNGDFRASTTSANAFDRVYDTSQDPTVSNDQAMAGIMNAFYVTNWLHDWWYDSGFDEAAGNAQENNFLRGGAEHDRLHLETQDNVNNGGLNNSNMTTPTDGTSPKMQIYVWSAPTRSTLTITPPGTTVANNGAGFGPRSFDITGNVVLVDDNMGNDHADACEAIVNSVAGKVALIDRGTCTFKLKVVNAQTAGAIGVIIADNNPEPDPPALADGQPNTMVNIGALSVTQAEGVALKASLLQGAVTAKMNRVQEAVRDGALDNQVVAHEWGHYLHHRLVDCAVQQCNAMSEGWGDFSAMMMTVRDGDALGGSYAMAIYGSQYAGDAGYFGIRRQPYSVDMSKDGLSFRHISDGQPLPNTLMQPTGGQNSEVHNAGEVWATMLFEGYVALQQAGPARMPPLGFDQMRRRMSDYVVVGLQMTPVDATYTEARDGILAAAAARDLDDTVALAGAFARRGAGSCAVSPPRDSMDLTGVIESSDVKPRLVLGQVTLDDSVRSCDHDGILDAGERGKLIVHLTNGGPTVMTGTKVTLASTTVGATFPTGTSADVPPMAPLSSASVPFDVELDATLAKMGPLSVAITAANASSCELSIARTVTFRINADDVPASSASDDVESAGTVWTPSGMDQAHVWSRIETAPLDHAWHGADFGSLSDTWLESPDLTVSATVPLVVTFTHRHDFETGMDQGMLVDFDGAVIEITTDGGTTWDDAANHGAKPPYAGVITAVSGNPLAGRNALVAQNPSWPMTDLVTLDFGMNLAGKTARLRFRIGTDQAAGFTGWDIDDIGFAGIDNQPFASQVDDRAVCTPPPPDGGARDASDSGAKPGSPDADSGMPKLADNGCGCHLGARSDGKFAAPAIALLLLCGALLRRRRR